MGADSIINPE